MKILHKVTNMFESHLLSKINISKKKNYLVIELEEALTDTEFLKLQNLILQKVSENSVAGVVLHLNKLMVIDSFTTKIFQDLAHSTANMGRSLILVGIRDDVEEVMEKQGLHLTDGLVERNENIIKAITQ